MNQGWDLLLPIPEISPMYVLHLLLLRCGFVFVKRLAGVIQDVGASAAIDTGERAAGGEGERVRGRTTGRVLERGEGQSQNVEGIAARDAPTGVGAGAGLYCGGGLSGGY